MDTHNVMLGFWKDWQGTEGTKVVNCLYNSRCPVITTLFAEKGQLSRFQSWATGRQRRRHGLQQDPFVQCYALQHGCLCKWLFLVHYATLIFLHTCPGLKTHTCSVGRGSVISLMMQAFPTRYFRPWHFMAKCAYCEPKEPVHYVYERIIKRKTLTKFSPCSTPPQSRDWNKSFSHLTSCTAP